MKCATIVALALAAMMAAGCGPDVEADPAHVEADRFVIYALDPVQPELEQDGAPAPDTREKLHGYVVLGEAEVADRAVRRELMVALAKGIAENDGTAAKCFDPRHGIRIETKQDVIEYVICFECLSFKRYVDGAESGSGLVSQSPAGPFNRIYRAAGLTIAP